MGWFVDDARARKILLAGRFAPKCVLVSTTSELVYFARILANKTLFIVE
jgi:hypothetical protein